MWQRLFLVFSAVVFPYGVAHASFSDVPEDHPAFLAITELSNAGVIRGYEEDNTFRPGNLVNRAEAIKMLTTSLYNEEALRRFQHAVAYEDIPESSWYASHAALALQVGAIDGPPEVQNFHGARPVILAEFLKMLFLLDKQNVERYHREEKSVAEDIDDLYIWYYPYVAHGVTTTMITPYLDDSLHPGKQLTRADVALYLYRYLLYRQGKHIDRAKILFSDHVDAFIEEYNQYEDTDRGEQLCFRLVLLSYGMLDSEPKNPEFLALQQVAWGLGKIILGDEKDVVMERFEEARKYSEDVYTNYFIHRVQARMKPYEQP